MNYILVMTLSGSCMFLLYFLEKHTFGKRLSKGWQYFFLKTAMLYYMIPLPFMGTIYREMLRAVFSPSSTEYFHYFHNEKLMFQSESRYAVNSSYQYEVLVIGIWYFISFAVLTIQFIRYLRIRRAAKQYCSMEEAAENVAVLNRLKKVWKIKRKITLYLCDKENAAFTMGTKNPVIICSLPKEEKETEMLLEHELIHIKRFDVLWKIAGTFVKALHWFNPVVYLFLREFERVCEESCDELVVEGRGEEECFQYAAMVVKRSMNQERMRGWNSALTGKKEILSKGGEKVLERTKMIMSSNKNRRNKWGGLISALVVGAMVMLNSLTVLAYDDVKVVTVDSEKYDNEGVVDIIVNTGDAMEDETDTIMCDQQFVDEEGNVYLIEENQISPYLFCNHNYVEGTVKTHAKKSDGSCTVTYNKGQVCTKCEHLIIGEWIKTTTYAKCTH